MFVLPSIRKRTKENIFLFLKAEAWRSGVFKFFSKKVLAFFLNMVIYNLQIIMEIRMRKANSAVAATMAAALASVAGCTDYGMETERGGNSHAACAEALGDRTLTSGMLTISIPDQRAYMVSRADVVGASGTVAAFERSVTPLGQPFAQEIREFAITNGGEVQIVAVNDPTYRVPIVAYIQQTGEDGNTTCVIDTNRIDMPQIDNF